jgi:hypothetical protein
VRPAAKNGLFHDFVGPPEKVERDIEPEGFGGLEVDDQFELIGSLNRQIGRLSPLRIRPA